MCRNIGRQNDAYGLRLLFPRFVLPEGLALVLFSLPPRLHTGRQKRNHGYR